MANQPVEHDSPLSQPLGLEQGSVNATTHSPPITSGSSRQARRLQLRNAGFRGATLTTRKISPRALSYSNFSSLSGMTGASDIENVSPPGSRDGSTLTSRRESGGVLQEIGNSTITRRPKKARHRVTSKAYDTDAVIEDQLRPISPPLPRSHIRRPSLKSKAKVTHRRRSTSADKYIEHLESELASAQAQLSSVTSPSAAREHSTKVRTLNVEAKKLQDELADWETKYEQRVQEEVDRHLTIETDLKARIRHLETDADDAKFRIQDLEIQLETKAQHMQAVEIANVGLEKRIGVMTELLASTKVDLHAETPGRTKRHVRPKSMLPRFPTASSLMGSPERQPRTQPASPLSSFTNFMPNSPRHSIISLDISAEHTEFGSEAGSIFSEDSGAADSMTSAENCDTQPGFHAWHSPSRSATTAATTVKPVRRMRRFGAGSLGPKPLILPSTSQCEYFPPVSAPPLEHSRTSPAMFPTERKERERDLESPLASRRRASTMSNGFNRPRRSTSSPFLNIAEAFSDDRLASLSTSPSPASSPLLPRSAISGNSTRRHSSFGPVPVRNLMEELDSARSFDTMESDEVSKELEGKSLEITPAPDLPPIDEAIPSPTPEVLDGLPTAWNLMSSPWPAAITTTNPSGHRRTHSRKVSISNARSNSMLGRVRALFGHLWRSPVTMARYLIQTAQARMQIPRPLLNVQWWLVGVLLGPMAKRRMLSACNDPTHHHQDDDEGNSKIDRHSERLLLLDSAPDTGQRRDPNSTTAYGSIQSRSIAMTKRSRNKMRCTHHHHHHHRTKHSPWLWIKFSITLAFAIGVAFKDGPGSLLKASVCRCSRRKPVDDRDELHDSREAVVEVDGEEASRRDSLSAASDGG